MLGQDPQYAASRILVDEAVNALADRDDVSAHPVDDPDGQARIGGHELADVGS